MAIVEADFDSEKELERWVKDEFSTFLPASVLLDGFIVSTPSGKKGVPDGFAFDFDGRQWYVIECELLKHGVWRVCLVGTIDAAYVINRLAVRRKSRLDSWG